MVSENLLFLSEVLNTSPPPNESDIPRLLMEAIHQYQQSDKDIFYRIAEFHITFERIHPLSDANGKTGRVLITKELLANDYAPCVITIDERSKYMELLAKQNISGLSDMLMRLNNAELERMERFSINISQNSI